jgi:hypothetical protein
VASRKDFYINKMVWKASIGRLHCFLSSTANSTKRYRLPPGILVKQK